MANVVELANVKTGEDKFCIVLNGQNLGTHPTRKGAEKLAARYNETGSF
jgi:hypothetical protein